VDTPIDSHIGQLEADDPIVGLERQLLQSLHRSGLDPLVAPPTQRGSRTLLIGYPPVGAAEHQDLDELLEDHVIGYAATMTAQRVVFTSLEGNKARNCCQIGSMMYGGSAGMGVRSFAFWEASITPRMIEHPCPLFTLARHSPIGAAS
jgi:hypothetical protein